MCNEKVKLVNELNVRIIKDRVMFMYECTIALHCGELFYEKFMARAKTSKNQ